MKSIVVLYHGSCPDGFGAAWAAWKKFGHQAAYIPVDHGKLPPAGLKNKEIYMLDFCYSKSIIKELVRINKKVIVLDHHISQKEDIKAASFYIFSNDHSGAVMTWNYFYPNKKMPVLLLYLEDGDYWRFKLPDSSLITTYIYSNTFKFEVYGKIAKELETAEGRKKAKEKGLIIQQYEKLLVDEAVGKAQLVEFQGIKTLAANCSIRRLNSEIGHALYEKLPPMGIVWYETDDEIRISLRSNGKVDLAKITKKLGGGGHKQAASFRIPVDKPFPWKRIKN